MRRFGAVAFALCAALLLGLWPARGAVAQGAFSAERLFAVVNLYEAADLPDVLFEADSAPTRTRPVFFVYQNAALLQTFKGFDAAVAYAVRYANAAVVAEGTLFDGETEAEPAVGAGVYAVYQKEMRLKDFTTWREAKRYAGWWSDGAVAGRAVVWHNYDVWDDSRLLNLERGGTFDGFAVAAAFAGEQGGRAAVISPAAPGSVSPLVWEPAAEGTTAGYAPGTAGISQFPELDRGCEVTALAMLLNWRGVKADKMTLAAQVRKSPHRYDDPNNGFIGDMYTFDKWGFGVYHGPIAELAERYLPGEVVDATGCRFEDLTGFLAAGRPVWVIINSRFQRLPGSAFQVWNTPVGKVSITMYEHSVLVTGFDKDYVYYQDPKYGEERRAPAKAFAEAWEQMGRQAVAALGQAGGDGR